MLSVPSRHLRASHIRSVLNGNYAALYVPDFCSRAQLRDWSEYFRRLSWEPYTHEQFIKKDNVDVVCHVPYGVSRPSTAGLPYNTTYGKGPLAIERYCEAAIRHQSLMNRAPRGNPMMRVISKFCTLGLEAKVAKLHDGRPMITGMPRLSTPGIAGADDLESKPHVDHNHDLGKTVASRGQFSVNIYLEMPSDQSGHVMFWRKEQKNCVKLLPVPGSMCFFGTQQPHAVGKTTSGHRLTVQSFVAWSARNELLFFN
jgi:hypothetical protein